MKNILFSCLFGFILGGLLVYFFFQKNNNSDILLEKNILLEKEKLIIQKQNEKKDEFDKDVFLVSKSNYNIVISNNTISW